MTCVQERRTPLETRPYQEECLQSIISEYHAGVRQQLVVACTGSGKTYIFSELIRRTRSLFPKVLVFAHREELVDQTKATVLKINPTLKVGKEMAADYADPDCDVVVSCVASIGRNGSTRLARFGQFDMVICDECHRIIAQTYLNVLEATEVLKLDTKKLLVGFTATPKRHDRKRSDVQEGEEEIVSLKSVFQKIVFPYPIRTAIRDGWLVPLKGFRLKTDTNLDNVKVTAGDFQQDQLTNVINTSHRNLQILKSWLQYGEGRQTVGFTSGIEHAKNLAELFKNYGIKAEAIWGADPERAQKLIRHRSKEITVLFNAQLLTEGYDDWRVSCIIAAAPTRNSSKYTQEIGRGTRLQEGTGNLLEAISRRATLDKKDCYILDVCDSSKKCSLVTLPSLLGLNPEMDLHGGSVTEAADKMEELQEKYPTIDLSALTDIDKVDAYIESIDLFAEPYSPEVKELSQLGWVTTADGSFVLPIPEKKELVDKRQFGRYLHEKLHISQNDLEEYDLSITTVSDNRKLGTFSTLKEAFEVADDIVRRCRPDRMKLLTREGWWKGQPASEAVKKYLRSLSRNRPLLRCTCEGYAVLGVQCKKCKLMPISAGEASIAIDILKNTKRR